MLWLILLACAGLVAGLWFPIIPLCIGVIQVFFIYRLASALHAAALPYAVASLIPFVGLFTLLHLNGKATKRLRAAGLRVGFMGVPESEIRRFRPTGTSAAAVSTSMPQAFLQSGSMTGSPLPITPISVNGGWTPFLHMAFIWGNLLGFALCFFPSVKAKTWFGLSEEYLTDFGLVARCLENGKLGVALFAGAAIASGIILPLLAVSLKQRWVYLLGASLALFSSVMVFSMPTPPPGVEYNSLSLGLGFIFNAMLLGGFFVNPDLLTRNK